MRTRRKASWSCFFSSILVERCGLGNKQHTGLKRRTAGRRLPGGLPTGCGQSVAIGGQGQPNRKLVQTYIHVLLNIKLAGG